MINSKGLTLIEVILTIVILAVAIPGVFSAVDFMTARQVNTIGTTTAADLAQERMEQIEGDRMNPARGFGYVTAGNYPAENPVAGFPNYNRSVTITCFTNSTLTTTALCPTHYKKVEVTVQAVGVGTNVPSAVLVTLVTNH
ncbi:MAG TPA: prepilin-type N-terminal cleavage/methylation domain-containing protein [Nitrospiria bacterium]|jgi:prepilin-type N-terminal cleavage/methylation domain-containing protein|nr:prepilin-type N-terminal cleavage/methylation domain-containing protein [Nitrospiria bacterium]